MLEIGDVVWVRCYRREDTVCRVLARAHVNYYVLEHTPGQYMECELSRRICVRCGYGKSAHAESGKCIYGPGTWEAP